MLRGTALRWRSVCIILLLLLLLASFGLALTCLHGAVALAAVSAPVDDLRVLIPAHRELARARAALFGPQSNATPPEGPLRELWRFVASIAEADELVTLDESEFHHRFPQQVPRVEAGLGILRWLDWPADAAVPRPPLDSLPWKRQRRVAQSTLFDGYLPFAPPADALESRWVVCTMVRDELRFLVEWLSYYLVIGAHTIIVYDNDSAAPLHFASRLFPGMPPRVFVVPWPTAAHWRPNTTNSVQSAAWRHCYGFAASLGAAYCACLDVDEFLVGAVHGQRIDQWLARNGAALRRWQWIPFPYRNMLYSGHLLQPAGPVLDNYLLASPLASTFGKWARVMSCAPEDACVNFEPWRELSESQVRPDQPCLYHFYTKSLEDFGAKVAKHQGMPDANWQVVNWDWFAGMNAAPHAASTDLRAVQYLRSLLR